MNIIKINKTLFINKLSLVHLYRCCTQANKVKLNEETNEFFRTSRASDKKI